MNNSYVILSDGVVAVSDEKGNIKKRKISTPNIEKKLIVENRLEYIDQTIKELEAVIKEYRIPYNTFEFKKDAVVLGLSLGITSGISYMNGDLSAAKRWAIFCGGWYGFTTLFRLISNAWYKKDYKERVKGYEEALKEAKRIREIVVADMEVIETEELKSNVFEADINKPYCLDKDQQFKDNTNDKVNNAFSNGTQRKKYKNARIVY